MLTMKGSTLRFVVAVCLSLALAACAHRAVPETEPTTDSAPGSEKPAPVPPPRERLNLPLPPPPPTPPKLTASELRDLARTCAAAIGKGKSESALEAARRLREAVSDERLLEERDLEDLRPVWGLTLASLARWDEVMEDSPPPTQARYATAMWHFVRASAFAAADRLIETEAEYNFLRSVIREPDLATKRFGDGSAAIDSLAVAERVVSSEIARLREVEEDQLQFLTEATRVQDAAPAVAVPPIYPWPRLQLAAALLRAGYAREAEFALREQLAHNPTDGWALWGLSLSLRVQGKKREAARTDEEFRAAWKEADISPDGLYR